jgi:ribulose 1,5-bisphosphate synthetase/thiazole synthase
MQIFALQITDFAFERLMPGGKMLGAIGQWASITGRKDQVLFMDARHISSRIDTAEPTGHDCEFVKRLEQLNEDVATLRAEARELGHRIAEQMIRLLEALPSRKMKGRTKLELGRPRPRRN